MKTLIEVNNLYKNYGHVRALQGVSFKLDEGEIVGFIGPNGAGKSTTLRILLGLIKQDQGQASLFGMDAWNHRTKIHKQIAYVPGEVELWDNLTGMQTLDFLLSLHGSIDHQRKDGLIERFNLNPHKKVKTYSKGNKQKIALIASLALDVDAYIFDEPTSGLDPLMEQVFQQEVLELKKRGKAVLLSSHILSEVEKLCDRVVIIREGQIVEEGKLQELRHLTSATLIVKTEKPLANMAQFEGVFDVGYEEDYTIFSVENQKLNQTLKILAHYNVLSLEVKAPTLEDLFMRHYE